MTRKLMKDFGDTEYWRIWDQERKLNVMRVAVKAKFDQNPKLKEQLLATGDSILIEDSLEDDYWYCLSPKYKNIGAV